MNYDTTTESEPAWVDLFLRQLRAHGLIHTAATTAGVTKRTVDRLRESSAEFDYAVEAALEAAADELELEARRRAVEGVEKGVYFRGNRTDTEIVYSDSLLTTLLKAKRADEFAERKQITGAGGTPLTVVVRTFGESPQETAPAATLISNAAGANPQPVIDAEFTPAPAPTAPAALADVLDMV